MNGFIAEIGAGQTHSISCDVVGDKAEERS